MSLSSWLRLKRAPETCSSTEQTKVLSHEALPPASKLEVGCDGRARQLQEPEGETLGPATTYLSEFASHKNVASSVTPSKSERVFSDFQGSLCHPDLQRLLPGSGHPNSFTLPQKCQDHTVLLDFALSVSSALSPDTCWAKPFPPVLAHLPLTGRAFPALSIEHDYSVSASLPPRETCCHEYLLNV